MRVIVATAFGPAPSTALLRSMPWPPQANIEVLHVISGDRPTPSAASRPEPAAVAETRELVQAFTAALGQAMRPVQLQALEAATVTGDVAREIVRRAAETNADLIVVGGPRRLAFRTSRSVAARLIGRTPCALLIARTDRISGLVLVADDYKSDAVAAMKVAEHSFLFARSPVIIVRALDLVSTVATQRRPSPLQEPAEYLQTRMAADAQLKRSTAQLARAGRLALGLVRSGPKKDEILRVARALRVDTIVISAPMSPHRPADRLAESLVRGVALDAECSVLVTPHE